MSPSRDPFGFSSKSPTVAAKGTDPIVVVAHPGQEFRVIIADDAGPGGRLSNIADSTGGKVSSPSGSGDSGGGKVSSPSGSGDSGGGKVSSPSGSGDSGSANPFGFKPFAQGFSPTPITVVAHAGQEIRIVVPGQT